MRLSIKTGNRDTHCGLFRQGREIILFLSVCLCLFCLLPLKPTAARAPGAFTLYLPVPEDDQLASVFQPFAAVWQIAHGQTVHVETIPGQAGAKAWATTALKGIGENHAAAVILPTFFILPTLDNAKYASDELAVVAIFGEAPHVLWVPQNSPHTSLQEFLAFGRKRAEEENVRLCIAGTGSFSDQHLATLMLERASGIPVRYVPVLGSAQAAEAAKNPQNALVWADACWGYDFMPQSMAGMRPLAIASENRSANLPDVPTFAEAGLPVKSNAFFGFAIHAANEKNALAAFSRDFYSLTQDAGLQAMLRETGFSLNPQKPESLPIFIQQYREKLNTLLEEYPLVPKTRLPHEP